MEWVGPVASLEEENEERIAKIMRRSRLKHRDIPKLIKVLHADIQAKRRMKDMKAALDKTTVGKLVTMTDGLEQLAKFFKRRKLYSEIKVPIGLMLRQPELKPDASVGDYVALAVVARIFLLKYHKLRKRKEQEATA